MRLFCDENIRNTTVQWLRDLGHDAISVKEAGMAGMADENGMLNESAVPSPRENPCQIQPAREGHGIEGSSGFPFSTYRGI